MTDLIYVPGSSDDAASKRTLLGVGLASLLRPAIPVEISPPLAACEPSIQVSGEISNEGSYETSRATREPTSKIVRRDVVFPPMPRPRQRKLITALVATGAIAASIAIGLGARSARSSDEPTSAAGEHVVHATELPLASTTPVAAIGDTPTARALPPVASPAPRPATAPPAAARAPALGITAGPRVVDLGDGSCSVFVDAAVGGDVSVDEQIVGATPVTVTGLWCGRQIAVRVQRREFVPWARTIVTQEGRTSRVKAVLRRPLPPAPPSDALIDPTRLTPT